MNRRITNLLKRALMVALPMLLVGCTLDASSGSTTLQDLQTFVGDFARQILTAMLL